MKQERVADAFGFFQAWFKDPLRVAAVAPSGRSLAKLITSEIDVVHAPVLELGPGTGVFTRALLDRGLAQKDLTLIEFGQEFAILLEQRFPTARVVQANAASLSKLQLFPHASVGAIVSGLGLLSMSPRMVIAILQGGFAYLRPQGAFYQFTYGPRCPVPRPILDRLGLKARRIGGTMFNVPPASVYRITRRGSRSPVKQISSIALGSR
ncbi:class I SAM-dependent methyltransferase [Salipiger abyssi]|uniref:class I SAM-dependent methyltransferase n=1 Tax=Salipiger abyssi TaxID=1250539 RepID=UPI000975B587|nr:methyltransferase domain-containing protein [Salipiger abyssi]